MSDSTSNAASTIEPQQVETATVGDGEADTGAFAFVGGERS
jgi:phosphoketolase